MKKLSKLFTDIYYYLLLKLTKTYEDSSAAVITRTLKFERDPDSRWYVCLPEWKGSRSALLMVAGADVVLEELSEGKSEITLLVSINPLDGISGKPIYSCRKTSKDEFGSGDYVIKELNNRPIWLCSILSFVFGKAPDYIYFTVLK